MDKPLTYGKKEKLKSRRQLTELFAKKQSFLVFPVKVFYLVTEGKDNEPLKVGVGVNSRNFKKAVHRNRIKRLLREAYRLNKLPLHTHLQGYTKQVVLFFLYVDKSLPVGKIIAAKMPIVIRELIKRLDEANPQNT